MKISAPKEKFIFIELNRNDMEKLHLSYEKMDYKNEDTRKAIYSVLREAKMSLGQNFELSDTLKVEALPRDDGGCFLFFTISGKKKRFRYSGKESGIVFGFDDIDRLIDLSASMSTDERKSVSSKLYLDGRKYLLLIEGSLYHSIVMKLCEYGYVLKNKDKPFLSEKKCVIDKDALEILFGGVSK